MDPSYVRLHHEGILSERKKEFLSLMESCRLCPRECGVNRLKGDTGFCGMGNRVKVAGYNAHFGEETPLVGRYGSGTIFFSSCNLLCSFCQNYEISHLAEGVETAPEQLAAMMIYLFDRGCHNINFVTPTHCIFNIIDALILAVDQGLRVPLVYNSSGYDRKETLKLLDGIFDIYMPDFKFWDDNWAERYCDAPDYRATTMEAIREMHRQVGDLVVGEDGTALKGLIVRHLIMPDNVAGTENIMKFLATEISSNTYINIMDQYRPCGTADQDEFINRRITAQEYRNAVNSAKKAGLIRLDPRDRSRLVLKF